MTEQQDNEQSNELSSSERKAFESLPREKIPPAEIEDKVVSELKYRKLLSSQDVWWRGPSVYGAIAAALVIFAVGVWTGRVNSTQDITTQSVSTEGAKDKREYILLLHEDPQLFAAPVSVSTDDLVAEYTAWARNLAAHGVLTGGEKLTDETLFLTLNDETSELEIIELDRSGEFVSGYFSISAHSTEEALEISSTCPHLKYGGEIELREIDKR